MTDKPTDLTQPVQTRDGQKAKVIYTERVGPGSVVALVGGGEALVTYTEDGRFAGTKDHRLDLVNIPPGPVREVRYAALHTGLGSGDEYETRVSWPGRPLVKATFEDGVAVSVELLP